MATTRTFDSMLNEYLPYELLMEELQKRSFLLENVEKDNDWKGGGLIVPFKGASATSFSYGALTAASDIGEYNYVRGEVSGYKEIWGAMKWNARDLIEHSSTGVSGGGMVNEQSFLKILPDQIDDFMDGMKQVVSVNLLIGNHFAKLTSDASGNDGTIVVDRPERFELGQKVYVDDDDSAVATAGYVRSVDINTSTIILYDARTGGSVIDFSAGYTVAQNAKCYFEGAQAAGFTSVKDQLLSNANGGSANLFGQVKTAYPYLQAVNVDGSAITATNILDKLFDAWTTVNKLGKGHASDAVMSYTNLGYIMKLLEAGAGAYRHVSTKASTYGYTEILVIGVKGQLKIVGVHEMDDDVIFMLDWRSMKLHSNGFFRKQVSPEGLQYFTVRETTGYSYICDLCFYGELVVNSPCRNGIIHSISI